MIMNLLKMAVRLNFLAMALFIVNAGVAIYMKDDNYWKYLGFALFFLVMGFFYRRKYRKKLEEEANS
jgi:positive regulator of sigma E activity